MQGSILHQHPLEVNSSRWVWTFSTQGFLQELRAVAVIAVPRARALGRDCRKIAHHFVKPGGRRGQPALEAGYGAEPY